MNVKMGNIEETSMTEKVQISERWRENEEVEERVNCLRSKCIKRRINERVNKGIMEGGRE